MREKGKQVILVAGLPGSQKTTLCKMLTKKGFSHLSMSSIVYKPIRETNKPITLENLLGSSLAIRREFGEECLATNCIEEITKSSQRKFVVDGIRTPEEVKAFKNAFQTCKLIAIHSTRLGRYEYMVNHPESLVRTYEQANTLDSHELALGVSTVVLLLADYFVLHDGLRDRTREIERSLGRILADVGPEW